MLGWPEVQEPGTESRIVTTESPLLFGKYQLLERVARGGMAEVFKAKSYGVEGFEKLVVIKRILPDLAQNQQFVDMFLSEARLSVALSHANIVQVFDLGREEDTYFIAMEFVPGMDFAQALRQCRRADTRAPTEISVYIACEVARALDYAHRRRDALGRPLGVVHRDISPQNVLLSYEGEVKVTDFGIAKARTSIEEQGTVKGKYAYMAPEQATACEVDGRADIYSLGVTLYEALAGTNPFAAGSSRETQRRVRAGERTPLREAAPNVPEALARIVETAMSHEVSARQPSAAKLYEELSAFLYTTVRRVGPHDLSGWLQTLRGASVRPAAEDAHRIRDAVADEARSNPTPGAPPPAHAGSGPHAMPDVLSAGLERRDITLVALEVAIPHTFAGTAVTLEPLAAMARRHGATELHREGGRMLLAFGVRVPDGRDTEAATRCALKLQASGSRAMPGADVGVGVHPARIHVVADGTLGDDPETLGAISIARALAAAAGNRVAASGTLAAVAEDIFELAPLADGPYPGAMHVVGERGPQGGARRKVVGRKDAFRRFGELLAVAANEGLQVISVTGEVGSGKSRFLEEIHYRLLRMNHRVTWYVASCVSHGRDVPLSALQAMLQAILGIDETDPDAIVREKARRVRELGLVPEEMLAVGAVLGVVSSATAAEVRSGTHRPLLAAVTRIAARLAQDQLTVFVWDAAEHMDDASQALLSDLTRSASGSPVALVFSTRPGRVFPWDASPSRHVLTMGPLTPDDAAQLVSLRLEASVAPPVALVNDLFTKSHGNPLYMEEYLKALLEAEGVTVRDGAVTYDPSAAAVALPRTLRAVVAARVAAVPPTARMLLGVASVVGSRFALDLVASAGEFTAASVDAALGELLEREYVSPIGSGEYAFAHELLREVTYDGIALDARRKAHLAVAATIERLSGDRVDDHADRLAVHYREGGDRAKATVWFARAARRQRSEGATEAGVTTFARAIDLAQSSARPDVTMVLGLYAELGEAALAGARELDVGVARLRDGVAYAEELGDPAALAPLLGVYGRLLARAGRTQDAIAQLERARELLGTTGDRAVASSVVSALGAVLASSGDFGRALEHLADAVRFSTGKGMEVPRAFALTALARCQSAAGDGEMAMVSLDQAVALAGDASDVAVRVEVEKTRAEVRLHSRDFRGAAAAAAAALELAREGELPYEVAVCACALGHAQLRIGDAGRAFAAFAEARDVAREHGLERMEDLAGVYLSFMDGARMRDPAASMRLETALARFEAGGMALDALQVRWLLGKLWAELGEPERARAHLRDALALATATESRLLMEDCETALEDLAAAG